MVWKGSWRYFQDYNPLIVLLLGISYPYNLIHIYIHLSILSYLHYNSFTPLFILLSVTKLLFTPSLYWCLLLLIVCNLTVQLLSYCWYTLFSTYLPVGFIIAYTIIGLPFKPWDDTEKDMSIFDGYNLDLLFFGSNILYRYSIPWLLMPTACLFFSLSYFLFLSSLNLPSTFFPLLFHFFHAILCYRLDFNESIS